MATLRVEAGRLYNYREMVDILLEQHPKVCAKYNVHGKGCCLIDLFIQPDDDMGFLLTPITNHEGQHIGFDVTAPGKLELKWACSHDSYSWLVYNGLSQEEQSFVLTFVNQHNNNLRVAPSAEVQKNQRAELAKMLTRRK
jgi:hypothetical protein